MAFGGFSQQTLEFLQDVELNNSKIWFAENRAVYDAQLVKPFRALVEDLTPTMLKIDSHFITQPAIGKTISRINRDIRYSHNKSIYRSHFWLTFKRRSEDWKEAPCYFFEISPFWFRYGIGYYSAPKVTMDLFRSKILQDPQAFLSVVKCCKKPFEIVGDRYKRSLNKDLPEALAKWYNLKNFAVMTTNSQTELLFADDLVKLIEKGFKQIAPLYNYLMLIEMEKAIDRL